MGEAFRESMAAEFEELDARCEGFTQQERELGRFDPIAEPTEEH